MPLAAESEIDPHVEADNGAPLDLVLHGTWSGESFFLWAESSAPAVRPRGRRPKIPRHPHVTSSGHLRAALAHLCPSGAWDAAVERASGMFLPSVRGRPLMPPWFPVSEGISEVEEMPTLLPWKVTGLSVSLLDVLDLLVTVPVVGAQRYWGQDLHYWSAAVKLGLELLARQAYLPGLREKKGRYRAVWFPVLDRPADRLRLDALTEAMPPVCRARFELKAVPSPAGAPAPARLLDSFLDRLVDEAVRDWGAPCLDRRRKAPKDAAGLWWSALWAPDGGMLVPAKLRRDVAALHKAHQAWLAQLRGGDRATFRLCFRLEPPEVDTETGRVTQPNWKLSYLLQAHDDPSLLISLDRVWQARGGTLEYLTYRFEQAQERVLAGLGAAARLFPPMLRSLRTARPQSCDLTTGEAYAFLREVGPLLEGSGFGALVPPWWSKPAKLGVRAKVHTTQVEVNQGMFTLDTLVAFEWELALGDTPLSKDEFERLVALKMPLVQVRGQWVLLQPDEVETAIAFWERQRHREMTLRDALGIALGASAEVEGLPVQSVEVSGRIGDLLADLQAGEHVALVPAPEGFVGQLRPYQMRGASWLGFMRHWGLGACLADDMGLGKTIQAIALLLRAREQSETALPPALLVCPTSVVGNWKREIARFAPELRVLVHHGGERDRGMALIEAAEEHDVVITTYGLVRRDVETLTEMTWSDVILDEAQNIKNPDAKQTRAVRSLHSHNRCALTGTPVENRLSDLWSMMQFLNPGLLGTRQSFRKRYALPIERYQDAEATAKLRKLVEPFVLRRLKTDPAVIQDLPEKLEMKVYCSLTQEQVTLYQAVVEEQFQAIEMAAAEGQSAISRRGAILRMLLRLKQVCNHPAQYLGDGSALRGRSGKLERLVEMLEEALGVGDRALIFTQFREMGHPLQSHLQALFGVEVLYLHGGTPSKRRDEMVARFQAQQGPPIFILSLKAGGTGLNLTAANHVFHFDRWWNPAVEDQATDRAYRIGQTRDVQVHKFICAGTLEEKIDALIESKKSLAQSVVGAGEGWLTELSTDDLRAVITLSEE